MKLIQQISNNSKVFHETLRQQMTTYKEKVINDDGTISYNIVKDSYFLANDIWNVNEVGPIMNFKVQYQNYSYSNKNLRFKFKSPTINLELKYLWFQKLFREEYKLSSAFMTKANHLNKLTLFINQKYPNLSSLLDLDIEKAELEWQSWLIEKNYKILENKRFQKSGKKYLSKTKLAAFFRLVYSDFYKLTDVREEFAKERWDIRILNDKYNIPYNKSSDNYYIDFQKIGQSYIRESVKKYIKQRLLSRHNFTWASAVLYLVYIPRFMEFISSIEPSWKDLKLLKRTHIEKYIEWLHEYTKDNLNIKNGHPEHFISRNLSILNKFFEDIQRFEYDIAPETHVRLLIFPEDKPKLKKKSLDQIDYIPDSILEQLFGNIDTLHKDIQPVLWIVFKTGMRISDVLGLTQDCLVILNNKYYIETDIEKTYVKGHRIPIDEELASMVAVLIKESKVRSNQDNNSEEFIFIRYSGSRKGKPFSQSWVRQQLNSFAKHKNIVDENGDIFHFKTHQFRHTYAVKMLNGGADIFTVQELLAHASPEMTLRYAKLLDDTKRKAFETVINQGVFSFDLNGEVQEIKIGEDIPTDILDTLWRDHKLNAMDNPYGTCHARLNGNCPHMEAPPCLTCNGGSPCKDLAIGFSELDVQKYELHIKTTSKTIEVSKLHGREDIAEKNERNLLRYKGILSRIQEGNIIFGRQERMKRKQGVTNG